MLSKIAISALVGTATIFSVPGPAHAQASLGNPVAVKIPAGDLSSGLRELSRQARIEIIFNAADLRGRRTSGAAGSFVPRQALDQVVAGSGAEVIRDASGAYLVRPTRKAAALQPAETDVAGASQSGGVQDIVVTARRQTEGSLAVPVVITGIDAKEVERRNLNNIDQLSQIVPGLQIGQGTIQGGAIVLRGVGANANTTLADQGVTFNIDGAQVARSSVRRMGQMDIAQIEVLKGPQALFFGKNSPGGIISIRTADPTREFAAKTSISYEGVGRQAQFDGYASGPLTDTLGIRVAAMASDMSGWMKNVIDPSLSFASERRRVPKSREFAGRLTLKFEPSDAFDARLKVAYGELDTGSQSQSRQYVYCTAATPSIPIGTNGGGEDCKADDRIVNTDFGPSFAALDPSFGDGKPKLDQNQLLASLEANYRVAEGLTLTSVSSVYDLKLRYLENYWPTTDPARVFVANYGISVRELNQELRLGTSWDGPVNFMFGGFVQDSRFIYDVREGANATNPVYFSDRKFTLSGSHYSVFGQVRIKPVEAFEISAGGRLSQEKKRVTYQRVSGPTPALPRFDWSDFSPEVTAAWRPTRRLTLFASYKEGFLSGGTSSDGIPYDQQVTKGGEIGLKAVLFDNKIRANLSAYSYRTMGLQVSYLDGFTLAISNAGKGTVRGVEGDLTWQPGIEGLSLRGAVGYNEAYYNIYTARCYTGQTIALGCNLAPLANGIYSLQDLAGRPFNNAPQLTGNMSVIYDLALGSDWRANISADASYTSSFYTDSQLPPSSRLGGYWLFDAGLRLKSPDERWEFNLLGRNLADKKYYQITGSLPFGGSGTGGAGPSVLSDRYAILSRGRQVIFQITRKFGGA